MMFKRVFFAVFAFFLGMAFIQQAGCAKKPGASKEAMLGIEEKGRIIKKGQVGEEYGKRASRLQRIYFDFDKSRIRTDMRAVIKQNAVLLRSHPGLRITIEGHCDERGSEEYNMALGQRRTRSVRNYLVTLGIDPSRLNTISYGEELPLISGHSREVWSKNRRAEFKIAR